MSNNDIDDELINSFIKYSEIMHDISLTANIAKSKVSENTINKHISAINKLSEEHQIAVYKKIKDDVNEYEITLDFYKRLLENMDGKIKLLGELEGL